MLFVTTVMMLMGFGLGPVIPSLASALFIAGVGAGGGMLAFWRSRNMTWILPRQGHSVVTALGALVALATGALLADGGYLYAAGGLFCLQCIYHVKQYY